MGIYFVISKDKATPRLLLKGELLYAEELSAELKTNIWLYNGEPIEHEGIRFISLEEVVKAGLSHFST